MNLIRLTIVSVLCICSVAQAGPFTDEMSKCIVMKSTETDRTVFIQWIFAAMASHPDVADMSNLTPERKGRLNKRTADLITDLITVRCRDESLQAVTYEGSESFNASFALLGEVAMKGIMTHPKVEEHLSGLESYLDEEAIAKAFAPVPGPAPPLP